MNKPTSNYKMSKPTKTMLALGKFKNDSARAQWKWAMIDAELEASKKVKVEKTKD
jgi:hypothetical protein